jgi:LPXTG-site transpeptidase (sortase) family protein
MIRIKNKNVGDLKNRVERFASVENIGLALAYEIKRLRTEKKVKSVKQVAFMGFCAAILFAALFVVSNWQSVSTIIAYKLGWLEEPRDEVASAIIYDIKESEKSRQPSKQKETLPVLEVNTGGVVDLGPDNMIYIPKLKVKAPILFPDTLDENILLGMLRNGVLHYPQTALPSEVGNVVITGHSSNYWWIQSDFNAIFSLLPELTQGDEAYIVYGGRKYTYRVSDSFVLYPWQLGPYIGPSAKPMLTLITCVPVGTNWQRLVVRFDLVSAFDKNQTVQNFQEEPVWKKYLEKQIKDIVNRYR